MEERKLKDYKIRSGELNRTWNHFLAFWHLADGRSGHISTAGVVKYVKEKMSCSFSDLLCRAASAGPFTALWLPQHNFQTGLQRTVDAPASCFSEDQWHFCKIHIVDVDWTVLQGSTERGFSSMGTIWNWAAEQLCISQTETNCIPDWWLLPKAAS